MKSRVRLPGDIIFRLRLHQNLDPVDRDSVSRRSISCGILLFPPQSAYAAGLIGLSTPWMTPSLWMVVQICPTLGWFHQSRWSYRYDPDAPHCGVPRLLTTPGQTLMSYNAAQSSSARIVGALVTWAIYTQGQLLLF